MIIGIFGNMASGKTLIGVRYIYDKWKETKRTVISNIWLNFPHHYLRTEQLVQKTQEDPNFFKDCILFIDELHVIIDARRSSSLLNTNFTMWLTQCSKLGVVPFVYTSQLFDSQIDLRMREFSDIQMYCTRHTVDEFGKLKPVVFGGRISDKQIAIHIDFKIRLQGGNLELNKSAIWKPTQEDYNRYNTFEIVQMDRTKFMRK